jgi:hypothetical protein
VLEVLPDHAEARARLGYIKTDAGWVKREQQLHDQGFVQYDGHWVPRAPRLESDPPSKRNAPGHARAKNVANEDKPEQGRVGDMTAQQQVDPDALAGTPGDPFVHVR